MPVNKNAAFRYRIIDSCLRNSRKRYPSIEDIQNVVTEALNLDNSISISSLNKDLKNMKDYYNAPIKFHKGEKGYYYDDEDFSVNSFPLTSAEIGALDLSISFLKQIKYSGYFHQFESAIEKIISGFRISKIPGYENRVFLETEEPTADTGIKWLELVYEAILMKQAIEISYLRFNSDETKLHVFSPYVIREYRNRWYVTGYSELAEAITTLALDRVKEIKHADSGFFQDENFNEKTFFIYSFGATSYNDAQPEKVQLLFEDTVSGYITTKPLHQTQQIIDESNGLLIELTCYLTPELEMTILGYGENVKVIVPDVLAERIRKRVEGMNRMYEE